jgi:hypothetical protein
MGVAPVVMRRRCLAAFDLDPKEEDALTFGARSYMRLQITLKDSTGQSSISSRLFLDRHGLRINDRVEEAQLEAFDEDLFNEVGDVHLYNIEIIDIR